MKGPPKNLETTVNPVKTLINNLSKTKMSFVCLLIGGLHCHSLFLYAASKVANIDLNLNETGFFILISEPLISSFNFISTFLLLLSI